MLRMPGLALAMVICMCLPRAGADEPFPAHRVMGNVYYVGSQALATYLITTPEGHILINSGFEETVPLIRVAVESLGFKLRDVKILLASHAHSDHVAGHALLKELTGAKVYVMRGDDGVIASGGEGQYLYKTSRWKPCAVDRVLEDGDEVKLGGVTLVARLTPGHTRGCTTWTWRVSDGGKIYDAVVIGSPNVNPGYRLVNNPDYPEIASDFAKTFAVLKALPCDLFLGAHGDYYGLAAKYERLASDPKAFVDPDGYRAYVDLKEKAFRKTLAEQQAASGRGQLTDADRGAVVERLDGRAEHLAALSRQIWEWAEVGYQETKSAALLKEELRGAGFKITDNIAGIPTAFSAEAGAGQPVIGILGEYDALPGLYQEAVPAKQPARSNRPGHGCGHNLFGTASAAAAIAVKEWLAEKGMGGTVRFYGCPAEEGGGGKIYMVRAGAFSDCDAVLHWHPGTENRASLKTNLANMTGKFRYRGTAAHASGSPDKGRSALDGVMLFTHAIELLREHVPQTTRMHYVITSGGDAPNVVPAFAEVYLYLRSPEMSVIDNVWPRILKCAEAGALASETKVELELINSAYSILPNDVLTKAIERNLNRVGGVSYTPEERAFAEALQHTFVAETARGIDSAAKVGRAEEGISYGSTDVGDVSWVVPTAGFGTATFVPGTPGHSWQSTACAGMSIGHKGMMVAAKTLTLTALDLFTDPAELVAAKKNFQSRKGGNDYRSRLPADQKPPLNYREKGN